MRPFSTTSGISPFPTPWRSWSRIRSPGTTRRSALGSFGLPELQEALAAPWARGAGHGSTT